MEDLTGRTLGQYEITEEIGRGGMAVVYRAVQPSIGREVAIKVLPSHFLQDTTFVERFNREVQVIARLEHRAILPVYDYGEEQGRPYIVMRYLTGGSLSDLIRSYSGGMPLDLIIHIIDQIAEGLDFAHRRGITHRDFKPSNVLLDDEGGAYLADFGIAKVAETTAQLTGSGILGTPSYMAPEMAESGGVSPLVDVYALGVTLYQMLTGRLPFDADTPMGALMAHIGRPIPDARDVRPDLPAAVQRVIVRAMAKNPAQRYQSAGALAAELRQAISAPLQEPEEAHTALEVDPYATFDAEMPYPGGYAAPAPPPTAPSRPHRDGMGLLPLAGIAFVALVIVVVGVAVVALLLRPRQSAESPAVVVTPALLQDVPASTVVQLTLPPATSAPTELPADVPTKPPTVFPTAVTDPVLQAAFRVVTRNNQWEPVIREIEGVAMALVPVGCFEMGSAQEEYNAAYDVCVSIFGAEQCLYDLFEDEGPKHVQCIEQPFWIDVTEVTNAQYGSQGLLSGADRPRENVDWFDAAAHCAARGARLPTEVEWEYAARGPDRLIYPWGNSFDPTLVNYCDAGCRWDWKDTGHNDGYDLTAEVGSFPTGASWVGAQDMAGNVFEWVSSLYMPYPYNAADGREVDGQTDPTGWRVVRGGAWSSGRDGLRTANRGLGDPVTVDTLTGFRCVRDFDAVGG